jgi:hypothetical protein
MAVIAQNCPNIKVGASVTLQPLEWASLLGVCFLLNPQNRVDSWDVLMLLYGSSLRLLVFF